MKIAYVSGVKFGHGLLEFLFKKNFLVSTIFSYEDSKREKFSDYISFDNFEESYNVKNIKVDNINDEKNVKLLREIKPDIILVMGWSQILKNEILKIPKLGVIGSHPTELPKYKGRAPIPWTILKELKESALTFFYMCEGIDNGDILDQKKFQIYPNDDALSLYNKITELGKLMLLHNLPLLEKGSAKRTKQNDENFIEYWKKRTPKDGKINWSKDAKEVHKLIRASTHPYPGAFTFYEKSKLIIWKADLLENKQGKTGTILEFSEKGILVGTGKGSIRIKTASLDNNEINVSKIFSKKSVGIKLK